MSLVLPSCWKGIDASRKERDFKWWFWSSVLGEGTAILTVFWGFCWFTSKKKIKFLFVIQMWNFDSDYNNESSNGDLQGCLIQFWASPCELVSATESSEGRHPVYPDTCRSSTDEMAALVAELPSVFLQLREISLSCLLLGRENNLCTGNKCC